MKPKPIHFAILLALLTGLVVNNSPTTLAGVTVPACADLSGTSTASVKIAGKVVAPGSLVRVPVGGTCGPNEVQVGFNGYARTILVSPVVTPTDNGTALLAAMNTASSGYLIKLEPGTYDLGTNQLIMKQGVDLEGSGQDLTFVTSQVSNNFSPPVSATVAITKSSELRLLTVANNANGNFASVISEAGNDGTSLLTNVTISSTIGSGERYGISGGQFILKNSTVTLTCTGSANCYGINNSISAWIDASIINVQINGSGTAYGVRSNGGANQSQIYNSLVYVNSNGGATAYGISVGANNFVEIRNVKLNLGCSGNCAAILSNNATPTIIDPFIIMAINLPNGSSGIQIYGISNNGSSSTIQGGVITLLSSISSTSSSYGIANNNSSPTIQNVRIINQGYTAGQFYGIYNNGGSSQIQNSNIFAGFGNGNFYAVYNTGGATPKIQNSFISAGGPLAYEVYNTGGAGVTILNSSLEDVSGTTSIFNDTGTTAKVAGSQIARPVSGPGISCLYSYKPDLTPLGLACS